MPVGFNVGPLFVHFYGLILMSGAVAGAWLAHYRARKKGLDTEFVWDSLTWVLIGGIIGARLWHVFTPPPSMVAQGITVKYYLTHPLDALAIWRGGLGIPGAVIGGALALYLLCRKRGKSFATWADIVAPSLALGQAIGRWGNFINQELYGLPTDLPWGIFIDPINRVPGFEQFTHFHPTFFYESIWNLANMALLLWLGAKHAERLIPGDLILVYLIGYPVGRFLLEFLRLDSAQVAGFNTNQTIMAVVALLSAFVLLWRHKRKPKEEQSP
ncbi:MAG: prolipoprotein diacylglyceryl transferase [Anaerolineales bacterium]|nr:prolipoprotein diacylglyceryl transferase [Chloroflexota bacterium]MBL6981326.1 prolipoprotein diacylglyceryl transferase [Anaerolineales bacterium]